MRELEHFVLDARKIGLLNATDTESLLHPLHEHMAHIRPGGREQFYLGVSFPLCFDGFRSKLKGQSTFFWRSPEKDTPNPPWTTWRLQQDDSPEITLEGPVGQPRVSFP